MITDKIIIGFNVTDVKTLDKDVLYGYGPKDNEDISNKIQKKLHRGMDIENLTKIVQDIIHDDVYYISFDMDNNQVTLYLDGYLVVCTYKDLDIYAMN